MEIPYDILEALTFEIQRTRKIISNGIESQCDKIKIK